MPTIPKTNGNPGQSRIIPPLAPIAIPDHHPNGRSNPICFEYIDRPEKVTSSLTASERTFYSALRPITARPKYELASAASAAVCRCADLSHSSCHAPAPISPEGGSLELASCAALGGRFDVWPSSTTPSLGRNRQKRRNIPVFSKAYVNISPTSLPRSVSPSWRQSPPSEPKDR